MILLEPPVGIVTTVALIRQRQRLRLQCAPILNSTGVPFREFSATPHLWSGFADKKNMLNRSDRWLVLAALLAFGLGYRSNPFKITPARDLEKVQGQYLKMQEYYYNGNYEGALALGKEINRLVPHYADVDQQLKMIHAATETRRRPSPADRLPAALRDSYYDAKIAFHKGQCEEVKANLRPLGRYEKSFDDEKIYQDCIAQKAHSKTGE